MIMFQTAKQKENPKKSLVSLLVLKKVHTYLNKTEAKSCIFLILFFTMFPFITTESIRKPEVFYVCKGYKREHCEEIG